MCLRRLPVLLMLGGIGLKGAEVLMWRLSLIPELLKVAIKYDPVPFWLAQTLSPLVFDQRRIFPTAAEATMFDAVLIIACGLEFLLFGFAIQGLRRMLHGGPSSPVPAR
jgi:hypothetical protein